MFRRTTGDVTGRSGGTLHNICAALSLGALLAAGACTETTVTRPYPPVVPPTKGQTRTQPERPAQPRRPANSWNTAPDAAGMQPEAGLPGDVKGTFHHEYANPFNIALLVPLSGRFAGLGQPMLQAAELALFDFHDPRLNLVPFDTQGDPYRAVEAYQEAKAQDMDVILGPLFSNTSAAVSGLAKQNDVPTISFSNDASLAEKGMFVMGMLPGTQYKTLIRFAKEQRINRFALLAPNNVYGGTVLDTVREALGGPNAEQLVGVEMYRADAEDDQLPVRVASVVAPLLQANNGLSALILPETGKRLSDIIQELRKIPGFNERVQLIGDASWLQNPEVMSAGALEGAWLAVPQQDGLSRFEQEFIAAYRSAPGNLSALAYDAVATVSSIVRANNAERVTRDMLTDQRGFTGIHGLYRFTPKGLVERSLAVYRLDATGNLVLLSPASGAFRD